MRLMTPSLASRASVTSVVPREEVTAKSFAVKALPAPRDLILVRMCSFAVIIIACSCQLVRKTTHIFLTIQGVLVQQITDNYQTIIRQSNVLRASKPRKQARFNIFVGLCVEQPPRRLRISDSLLHDPKRLYKTTQTSNT